MYSKSREIEQRLERIVEIVSEGRYSSSQIAVQLGVSVPTVSRCIGALRERGYGIRAIRSGVGWAYTLASVPGNGET